MIDPWCFECPSKKHHGMHYWHRNTDMSGVCMNCGLSLTAEEASRCFDDSNTLVIKKERSR